jgi:hypothetical protein
MVSGGAKNERKVWESCEKGERQWGWGKMPVYTQGPRVNQGRTVAVLCFPGCDSGELRVETTCLSQVSASHVRNERAMKEAVQQLKHQHRVYCLGRRPVEGDPSKRTGAHCHLQTSSR